MSTPPKKLDAKERLKLLWTEYGTLAIVVFLVLWVGTLSAIYVAVKMGWRQAEVIAAGAASEEGMGKTAGTFGVAYLMFRFTMPFRVAATFILTPIVAKLLERFGWRKPQVKG